jgi:peroxiredoxin (alkyl hydroperoxide reductase subunit C)
MADITRLRQLVASGASDSEIAAFVRQPLVQQKAPQFTASALMPNKEFKDISLSEYAGKYVVLFFYPLDFTFVCPTEIIAYSDRQPEFTAVNAQLIACSCDSLFTHLAWVNTPRSAGGLGEMKIPMIADFNKTLASQFGVLGSAGPGTDVPLRGIFIISPEGVIRQSTINDLPVGRNVDETLRLIKAFQFVEEHGEVCPANWQPGDKTMNADPEKSKAYFEDVNKGTANTVAASDASSFSAAIAKDGLTVVDYWAPWCKNCHKIEPTLSKLAAELTSVSFVKINTTEAESLAADNGITALPTIQLYKAGKKVGEVQGSDSAKIEAAIRGAL